MVRVAIVAALLGLLVGAAGGYVAGGDDTETVTRVRTVRPAPAPAFDDEGFGNGGFGP